MKASEVIKELEKLIEKHGDLEVEHLEDGWQYVPIEVGFAKKHSWAGKEPRYNVIEV